MEQTPFSYRHMVSRKGSTSSEDELTRLNPACELGPDYLSLDSFKGGWSGQSCLSNASAACSLFSRLKAIFHEQFVQVYVASLEVIFHAIARFTMPQHSARTEAGRGPGSGYPATRIYPAQDEEFFSIQEPSSH
jgi:hypothetical protein